MLIADANDIVAGSRKRRWLWFAIPPAATSRILCSTAIAATPSRGESALYTVPAG
jgi:hypothetical protein